MSTKALAAAEKMPLDSVLKACAQAIESRVLEEKTSSVSLPLHVWNQLWQQQGGNHKAAEAALAELINGVEAAWSQHKAVHLFGELCGMLTAEHSAVVTKRVLSLLSGDASPALVPAPTDIAASLTKGSSGAPVELDAAIGSLAQPPLPRRWRSSRPRCGRSPRRTSRRWSWRRYSSPPPSPLTRMQPAPLLMWSRRRRSCGSRWRRSSSSSTRRRRARRG